MSFACSHQDPRRRCAPLGAGRCLLGSGSALGWIIDRVTTDKASGIAQDPNDWCEEHEIPPTVVGLGHRRFTKIGNRLTSPRKRRPGEKS